VVSRGLIAIMIAAISGRRGSFMCYNLS